MILSEINDYPNETAFRFIWEIKWSTYYGLSRPYWHRHKVNLPCIQKQQSLQRLNSISYDSFEILSNFVFHPFFIWKYTRRLLWQEPWPQAESNNPGKASAFSPYHPRNEQKPSLQGPYNRAALWWFWSPVVTADQYRRFSASEDLAADGVLPNAAGAKTMARVFADAFTEIMKE